MEARSRRRGEHSYGLVLALVLASVVFQVASPEGDVARLVTLALGALTIMAAVQVAGTHRAIVRVCALLAAGVMAGSLVYLFSAGEVPESASAVVNGLLIAVAPTAVGAGVLRQLREQHEVTLHTLGGVLAIYLLIGMFFSVLLLRHPVHRRLRRPHRPHRPGSHRGGDDRGEPGRAATRRVVSASVPRWGKLRSAWMAAALPPLFICSLYDPGSERYLNARPAPVTIGGGPPGGVQGSVSAATPKSYGDCGPGARPEPGLQGQVPKSAQDSGHSKAGYRCNLKLVGQSDVRNRGSNFQLGWYRDCAYVGQVAGREFQSPDELDGVAVIDVANPRRPQLAGIVRSPVGTSQHEGVEVNPRRGVLVTLTQGLDAQYVEIYDVSGDCRKPQFKGRFDGGGPLYHGLRISPDGNTVYASNYTGAAFGQVLHVIDVSDMSNPRLIKRWDPLEELPSKHYGIHDLELSADGNRAYLGAVDASSTQGALISGGPTNTGPSMVVLDTTEVQQRRPNPELEVVSEVSVPNFGHTEQRARIGGRPYVFSSGETPIVGAKNCPWAWGSVIDVGDERRPRAIGEIKLEVNEEANCGRVGPDNAVYSIHYGGVDDPENTTKLFYTYYTGGLRVFDVRDPARPKEIAYYHPPPPQSTVHRPSTGGQAGDSHTPGWDSATSDVRYLPDQRQLWFVSVAGGFQVLQLTTPQPQGTARLLRQRRISALRRRAVLARASCTLACTMKLDLRLAGRSRARRTVKFGRAGTRTISFPLTARTRRLLLRAPRARLRVTGTVSDPETGELVHRFRSGTVRLRR